MQDANLTWRQDLLPNSTGDIALASGTELGQQRVLRRLLTNPGDYVWNPEFGAGLGQFVGMPCNIAAIRSVIRSQIFMESAVSRLPEPAIDVQSASDGSVFVQIRYVDAISMTTQVLAFTVGV